MKAEDKELEEAEAAAGDGDDDGAADGGDQAARGDDQASEMMPDEEGASTDLFDSNCITPGTATST